MRQVQGGGHSGGYILSCFIGYRHALKVFRAAAAGGKVYGLDTRRIVCMVYGAAAKSMDTVPLELWQSNAGIHSVTSAFWYICAGWQTKEGTAGSQCLEHR